MSHLLLKAVRRFVLKFHDIIGDMVLFILHSYK